MSRAYDDGLVPDAVAEERDTAIAAEVRLHDRVEYERAMDAARETLAAQADLERRAATDVGAAMEVVQQVFRRYNRAMLDGTQSEKNGWRAELSRACAHYNVLAGWFTTRVSA